MEKLTKEHRQMLMKLMKNSAEKGNLANSAIAIKDGAIIATSESLVVSNHDATAHAERFLVEKLCKSMNSYTLGGISLITVVEPCLMCLSACSQAKIDELLYIIPASQYIDKIPWMSDIVDFDKHELASKFCNPIKLIYLEIENKVFCKQFEACMKRFL